MFRARGARIDPAWVWVVCAFVGVGLLAGLAMPAGAAIGAWSAQGPEGGPVLAMAVDPASGSTLYAGTYGGLFKTTDGGASWAWTARDLVELWVAGVSVDPTDSETVYLATFEINRVYRSEDGGESWTPLVINVGRNVSIERVLVDPSNPMILYASGYNGLVKSTNGGASWALAESGLPNPDVQFLVLHPSSPAVLFAGTGDGLFKSTDRAGTWSAVGGGLPPGEIGALAIDPVTPTTMYAAGFAALYKTTDGGSSWTGAGSVARVGALVVDPSTPETVYAAGQNGVYRTTDGGGEWTATSVGLPFTAWDVSYLALDPAHPGTLYAGTSDGVFRSADRADTWSPANRGLVATDVRALAGAGAGPATGPALYAGTNGSGLHKSTDGGATWQRLSLVSPFVDSLAVDPVDPRTVYAGAGVSYKSEDAGATWTELEGVLSVYGWAVDPTDPETVYAASLGHGVFKTTDGGGIWEDVSMGLTDLNAVALVMDPSDPAALYVGTREAGVFKTVNGGASWTPVGAGVVHPWATALAIDPVAPSTVYAGTVGGGLYRTTDAGASWSQVSGDGLGSQIYDVAIDPLDHSVVYAAGNARVARSVEGGVTWATLGDGLRAAIVFALALDPADPAKVYAGGLGGGVADFDQRMPTEVFTSEHFPDFLFGVKVTFAGQTLPVQKEELCIPETLCVSGSLPGRSELFIRIVGPKPNGYLWPTLVKFSTSTLEVWITQVSTGITKYYMLEGAAPGTDDLPGYFDRTGFLPSP